MLARGTTVLVRRAAKELEIVTTPRQSGPAESGFAAFRRPGLVEH
jgi:hypothetical protein